MGRDWKMPERGTLERRVLLLALTQRDAVAGCAVLQEASITCERCDRVDQLCKEIAAGAGAVIGGIGVLYLFGITGMAVMLGKTWGEAALLGMAFLPGDVIKAVLAGLVTRSIARMRPAAVLSRG